MLAAAIREAGGDVAAAVTARDAVEHFTAVIDQYAAEADLIITSGGVMNWSGIEFLLESPRPEIAGDGDPACIP